MNKSRVKIVLAAVLVAVLSFMLFACDEDITVSSISIKDGQATSFALNDFSYSNIGFVVKYSDDSTTEKTLSYSMLSDEDRAKLSTAGTHAIKINYLGKTLDFEVTLTDGGGQVGPVDTVTVTVSFNTNGGAPTIPSISGQNSVTVERGDIATVTKSNQVFAGWYTDISLNNAAEFPLTTTTSRTLYAKWTAANVTVSFDLLAQIAGVPDKTTTAGGTITLPTGIDNMRPGFTFNGWYKDKACTAKVTNSEKYTRDTTLYAKWTPTVYTITYNLSNGNINGKTNAVNTPYTYGTTVVPVTPTRTGYTFVGWYDNTTDEQVSFSDTMPSNNMSVYARWAVEDPASFFSYAENLDGTLTILGYADDITANEIEIPNNIGGKRVTVIGANAFSKNSYLTSFVIAEGVKRIEAGAFNGCDKVVTNRCSIPSTIEYIGVNALPSVWQYDTVENTYNGKENNIKGVVGNILVKYQSGHSMVSIPDGITRIGPEAFKDFQTLNAVIIPASVEYVDSKAFSGAVNLSNVTFAAGSRVREVATDAFNGTRWLTAQESSRSRNKYIVFGNLLYKYLGSYVEVQTEIPAGIKYISQEIFSSHSKLINIDFAEESAIEYIGANAFAGTVWAKNRDYGIVNGILTTVAAKTNVKIYRVPNTVKTIGPEAFDVLRSNVDNIVLPSSVTRILPSAFSGLVGGFNLTLEGTQPPVLNDLSAFYRTAAGTAFIDVGIYVKPEALVSYQQKAADSQWGYLADAGALTYIRALSAQEILSVDGIETEYSLGSGIDVSNVRISYSTNDGLTYTDVGITVSNIDDFNTDDVGDNNGLKTMYVTYRLSTSFSSSSQEVRFPVEYRVYTEIGEIVSTTLRDYYYQGETLNLDGVSFRAVEYQSYDSSNPDNPYGDAKSTILEALVNGQINPELTIEGFDSTEITTVGELSVTYRGFTQIFHYTVAERAVQSIEISEYYLDATGGYVYTAFVPDPAGTKVLQYVYTLSATGDYMAVYGTGGVITGYVAYDGSAEAERFSRNVDASRFINDEAGTIEGVRYTENTTPAYVVYDDSAYHKTLDRYSVNPMKSTFGYLEELDVNNIYIKCIYDQVDINGLHYVGYLKLGGSRFSVEGFDTTAAANDSVATVYYGTGDGRKSCEFTYDVVLRTATDNFTFTFDDVANTAEITGLVAGYPSSIYLPESVIVGEKTYAVTSVAANAFAGAKGIDNMYITPSITQIGAAAFKGSEVARVEYLAGSRITAIANETFMNTKYLKSVIFAADSAITTIGNSAFSASALVNVLIPATVQKIGNYVFYNAVSLESFDIAGTPALKDIGASAFALCVALTDVTLNEGLLTLGNAAFSGCAALETVAIPSTVTVLADYVFQNCLALETVTMSGVTHIGKGAFGDCTALTSVTGGSSVHVFGEQAFYNASKLVTLTIDTSHIESVGISAFQQAAMLNINLADAIALVTIGDYAFMGTALDSINIPATVTAIGLNAFADCSEVVSVTINSASITEIVESQFSGMAKLTTVTFAHAGITSIGKSAFRGTALTSFTAPAGLITIGDYAFADCVDLATVTLNDGLTSIGEFAFSEADSLTTIEIPATVTTLGKDVFEYSGLTSITFRGTSQLTDIPMAAFAGTALTAIHVPASVRSIGEGAFYGSQSLTTLTVPALSNLESIGKNAFFSCQVLSNVSIGNRAYVEEGTDTAHYLGTTIGESAFESCVGLVNLILPNSITEIGANAFKNCTGLESVSIGAAPLSATNPQMVAQEKRRSALTKMGRHAFANTTKLLNLYITAAQPLLFVSASNNTNVQAQLFGTLDVNGNFTSHFTSDDFNLHIFVNPDGNDDVDRYTIWSGYPTDDVRAMADITTVYEVA